MTETIKLWLSSTQRDRRKAARECIFRGMGKVISLNAETDFEGRIPTLRMTDRQMLSRDAHRVGQDMREILEG